MKRVQNKVVLITGAAKGIGKATAELFAKEGANVILTDVDDIAGEIAANEIGSQATYYHLDVKYEKEWQKVTQKIVQEFGKLDILFNNAGIIGLGNECGLQDPENITLEDWALIHATNLDSVMLGCKYAIKYMKHSGGGSIINMSSRSGLVGVPTAAAYASSKAGIRNHTKSVALYCASKKYNIRCNSIHPGAILTDLWDPMLGKGNEKADNIKRISESIPLRHFGKPEDVAFAVLYLGSDESSYVNGVELVIDGGILAGTASSPGRKEN